ncbi:MAG: hypothetical protein HQL30_01470 [Candidatus Omnitrophica bacterium]|nr:hypothetical protein [Candidatus Omnitrophota bacterium]
MNRDILVAVAVSAAIHLFGMSMVHIINPSLKTEIRPFTKVSYLGPLLNKTAFDIMLESKAQIFKTQYNYLENAPAEVLDLKARSPERRVQEEIKTDLDPGNSEVINDFLSGNKIIPYFMLDSPAPKVDNNIPGAFVYKPEDLGAVKDLISNETIPKIRVKVLVAADGKIKNSEPMTTTGNPELDHVILRYVNNWVFEPSQAGKDDYKEIDILLNRGSVNDKT